MLRVQTAVVNSIGMVYTSLYKVRFGKDHDSYGNELKIFRSVRMSCKEMIQQNNKIKNTRRKRYGKHNSEILFQLPDEADDI